MPRRPPALLILGAVLATCAAAAPSPAAAASCTTPKGGSVLLETPDVLVTSGRRTRDREGGTTRSITACNPRSGRRTAIGVRGAWPGAWEDTSVNGLLGGRLLGVSNGGGGAESEEVRHRVVDVTTGRATGAATTGGTDGDGWIAVSAAGRLALPSSDDGELRFARPGGGASRVLAPRAAVASFALGKRTAYWRGTDGVPHAATVDAARRAPAGTPDESPRGTRGRCEPRGSVTLLRIPGARVYRTFGATETDVHCDTKTGKRAPLATLLGELALGTVRDLTYLGGGLASLHVPAEHGRTALVVLDAAEGEVVHAAVVDGVPTDVVFAGGGIAVADTSGVRLVRGTSVTTVDASGPASDPAFATVTAEDAAPELFWTTPTGPRSTPVQETTR